jgi:hypothetical protein
LPFSQGGNNLMTLAAEPAESAATTFSAISALAAV